MYINFANIFILGNVVKIGYWLEIWPIYLPKIRFERAIYVPESLNVNHFGGTSRDFVTPEKNCEDVCMYSSKHILYQKSHHLFCKW